MTTTFCPSEQRAPITAPAFTWQKCQIFVSSPTREPSSTYEDSWMNGAAISSGIGKREPGAQAVSQKCELIGRQQVNQRMDSRLPIPGSRFPAAPCATPAASAPRLASTGEKE